MGGLVVLGIAIVISGAGLGLAEQLPTIARSAFAQATRWLLAGLAAANIGLALFVVGDHLHFPFFLEAMEGTVLQHFQRLLAGQPLYPAPSAKFVALAYNPLYYYVSIPFSWILGDGLVTLRVVSILAAVLCGALLWSLVRRRTGSAWWALMAAGLFAGAYKVMDSYLDTAHADSSFLCATLAGAWLLDGRKSRWRDAAAIAVFCVAFWFKQHGALFLIGGLLYLSWRDGLRACLPHWAIGIALGPVLYVAAGPALFGSHFHFFTWWVPVSWSELGPQGLVRWAVFLVYGLPVLFAAAAHLYLSRLASDSRLRDDPLVFLLPVALATGLMGSLDTGSSNNVYIPMATWIILTGTLALHALDRYAVVQRWRLDRLALFASFALLVYDPRGVLLAPDAHESYVELVEQIGALDGPVYLPWEGYVPSVALSPSAGYVPLEDMIRGQQSLALSSRELRKLLAQTIDRRTPAYIITHQPLSMADPVLGFLFSHYREKKDWGERFASLAGLDHRWRASYPRFLYRFDSARER